MIRVKLCGQNYTYDVYQILILFFNKDEFEFNDEEPDITIEYNPSEKLVETVLCIDNKNVDKKLYLKDANKKNIKNAVKKTLLMALEEIKKKYIPWGILVGIRPAKIIHEYIKDGMSVSEATKAMEEYYGVNSEKAHLAAEVAVNEEKFLKSPKEKVSLYIDIPFCPSRCIYCSFTSNPVKGNEKMIESYLYNLEKEIKEVVPYIYNSGLSIDTIYMGGGTPTAISNDEMNSLLDVLCQNVKMDEIREFTIECGRPDSITLDKLNTIKNHGCSRISINPQTMNDETLKRIGRMHKSSEITEKFKMARDAGFTDINMDVIIGLPGEGVDDIENTLNKVIALKPDSITMHTMAVKRASIIKEKYNGSRNDFAVDMYEKAESMLRGADMHPYYMYRQKNMVAPLENVGYCFENKECIYNIQMISESITVIGLGSGGMTKLVFADENRIERVANVKDAREYIKRTDEMIEKKKKAIDLLHVDI